MNHVHRRSLRRSVVAAVVTCAGLAALTPAASAGEKVTICHATGSASNPYVTITVSVNAVPAHRAHHQGRDIIPATVGCVPPPVPVDVCPNIPGDQPTVPVGFVKDPLGNCVPVVVEPPFIPCVVSVGVTQTVSTVTGTPADDTIDCSAASPGKSIDGLAGNDTITATQFADSVIGGEGNDTITGLGGDDTLSGGTGNDTISGGDGNDTITGLEGNDTLSGEGGDDFVDGGEDDDVLSGGTGVNVLIGGNGIDTCDGGPCAV